MFSFHNYYFNIFNILIGNAENARIKKVRRTVQRMTRVNVPPGGNHII